MPTRHFNGNILKRFVHFKRSNLRSNMCEALKMPKVKLDEVESNVVKVLRQYTDYFNKNLVSNGQEPLTLRITGGWVRDKLLNHPSHDIDIGIDHLSGESFVNGLKDWLDANSESKSTQVDPDAHISKIHKIKMNPSKSKHLETCTTHLYGLDIDFVNLRSEIYSADSRIPVIEAGTPYEDAHRRDATLNSLFYNLSTLEVEDWTGKGIEDLKNGLLRTPLEPRKTFLDDPLRCLRLIRFAATYNFKIDDATLDAMSQTEIKEALDHKISRERIGVELKKIIDYGDVLLALNLLQKVGFGNIWGVGDTPVEEKWLKENDHKSEVNVVNSMSTIVKNLPTIIDLSTGNFLEMIKKIMDVKFDDEVEKISFYSALVLHFWGSERVKCTGKKGKENYVSFWCVINGIRMPLKMADLTSLIIRSREQFTENVADSIDDNNELKDIKRSVLAQRFILPYGAHWKLNFIVNYVLDCFENMSSIGHLNQKYDALYSKLINSDLQESYRESILVNGKEILKLLDRKPGPWLKPFNEHLFIWQLDHPTATKEEMVDFLLTIPIE